MLLDRRQFLKLVAASGMVATGTAAGWRAALGQADVADPGAEGSPGVADIVTAMAASLGHDPDRIFRFVREEVRYEPYAGSLRGASGTLVARAGNAVDQSILLAALLSASGVPVRFVSGPIEATAADALMATTLVDAAVARDRVAQSLLSDEDVAAGIEWTSPSDIPPDDLERLKDLSGLRAALERDREVVGARASGHLRDALDLIGTALSAAGIELPSDVSVLPPLERDRHVWVQAQQGPGWMDLDPTFDDLPPGQAPTVVTETVDSLPDELRHLVDFTVIAETLTGGTLAQEPILEATFFADELAYLGLVFGHLPAEELEGIGDVNLIGAGLSEGTRYNPLLVAGPLAFIGPRSISIGGGGGSGFGDFFGGGGEGLVEGETSAEWLDVSVLSPGGEPVVSRRVIFDRVGTAMREGGVVDPYAIPMAELVDLGDGVGAQYLPMRSMRAFAVSGATPNVRTIAQELARDDTSGISLVTAMFDATRALLGVDLGTSLGSRGFTDRPAITSLVADPTATGTTAGFDIWHRPFGTLGLADARTTASPAMVAGIIPYAVERALLGGDPASGAQPSPAPISVGAVFEAAAAQGIPTRLLSGSVPADAAYDPESRRLLQRALEAGQLVVIPERAVDLGGRSRLGWWLVDPGSGAVVDQMDDGGGQAILQRALQVSAMMLAFYALPILASWILCKFGIDAEALHDVVARIWVGDAPSGCGASGPKPPPPGPRMQPMTPYNGSPIEPSKAQKQWQEATKDNALH
jgi:hypothetical protein